MLHILGNKKWRTSSKKNNINILLLVSLISLINIILSCKLKNDYIITNISYGRYNESVSVTLEYNTTKKFDIKDYDIENIRNNSKIDLLTNLTFHADAFTPKILHFYILDNNQKRFGPVLVNYDFEYFINISSHGNLNTFGFEIPKIGSPFWFSLKNEYGKKYYKFDGANFLYTDTLIIFDQLLTTKNIYGFGERNYDFDLDIGKYTTWPNDTTITYRDKGTGGYNLMGHQPIGLHRTKQGKYLGLLFMNVNAQDLIINSTSLSKKMNYKDKERFKYFLRHITIGGVINYYITFGDTPEEAVSEIHRIIGRPILPPFWALGWHQSRWGYKNTKDLENVVGNYSQYNIPLDGLWTDLDFLRDNQNFKVSISHIETPFYIEELHKKNIKFIPLLDYGIPVDETDKYYVYGKTNKCFIQSNYTKGNLISYVWPGMSVFPDVFTVEGQNLWVIGLYDFYQMADFDGLWIDMNEPSMIYDSLDDIGEIIFNISLENSTDQNIYSKIPYIPGFRPGHESLSSKSISINAFSHRNSKQTNYFTMYNAKCLISKLQTEVTYRFMRYYLLRRPFVLSRANTIGHGNFGFHWLGDNASSFKFLKWSISGIFNYNIFGIPLTGADICGFHGNASDELCSRWHILGAFYPFSRNHNVDASLSQEPWTFGKNTKRREKINLNKTDWPSQGYTLLAAKKAIKLKYSLLRYTYSQFFLISLGIKSSYFKPCFFEFPHDEVFLFNKLVLNTHIMVGDAFLFIPDLNANEDNYIGYFPNCNFNTFPQGFSFINFNDNKIKNKQNFGQFKVLNGNYTTINLFLRGGKIIPYQNNTDVKNVQDLREKMISLIINPDEKIKAEGDILYDSDEVDPILNNTYLHMKIIFEKNVIYFKIYNIGNKMKNYKDHIIDEIIFYRASEIMKNCIYKKATIFFLGEKEKNVKSIIYEEKRDLLKIKSLNIPIYFIDNILLS